MKSKTYFRTSEAKHLKNLFLQVSESDFQRIFEESKVIAVWLKRGKSPFQAKIFKSHFWKPTGSLPLPCWHLLTRCAG